MNRVKLYIAAMTAIFLYYSYWILRANNENDVLQWYRPVDYMHFTVYKWWAVFSIIGALFLSIKILNAKDIPLPTWKRNTLTILLSVAIWLSLCLIPLVWELIWHICFGMYPRTLYRIPILKEILWYFRLKYNNDLTL